MFERKISTRRRLLFSVISTSTGPVGGYNEVPAQSWLVLYSNVKYGPGLLRTRIYNPVTCLKWLRKTEVNGVQNSHFNGSLVSYRINCPTHVTTIIGMGHNQHRCKIFINRNYDGYKIIIRPIVIFASSNNENLPRDHVLERGRMNELGRWMYGYI